MHGRASRRFFAGAAFGAICGSCIARRRGRDTSISALARRLIRRGGRRGVWAIVIVRVVAAARAAFVTADALLHRAHFATRGAVVWRTAEARQHADFAAGARLDARTLLDRI